MHTIKQVLFIVIFLVIHLHTNAQKYPENWYNLDLDDDKVYGVSSNKAYSTILKDKVGKEIIVAVIDGGVDITHPDLRDHIWINKKEIASNGIDDDGNGYVDDINGWNFIGGKSVDVVHDNLEVVRIYKKYSEVFENNEKAKKANPDTFLIYKNAKANYLKKLAETKANFNKQTEITSWLKQMKEHYKEKTITAEDVNNFEDGDSILRQFKLSLYKTLDKGGTFEEAKSAEDARLQRINNQLNYNYNSDYDSRKIVADNYSDTHERYYGNNNVTGPEPSHGTHVTGIIAAVRNNNTGIDGVADNVKIMVIRVVPDGDERDKDVANAIRYAAENGASIINMSFGKAFSTDKNTVDEAIKFAISKDVLMIHSSGNEGLNLDKKNIKYPNPVFQHGNADKSWITVGAVAANGNPGAFSNYGKKNVDVFAPGVAINSTIPGGGYAKKNGTSMATPVVTGLAAMLRSYYPELKAPEIKKLIMKSVTKPEEKVVRPGITKEKIAWKELCKSAGIVNVYKAFTLIK